jgi:integrase/recombinase XerD
MTANLRLLTWEGRMVHGDPLELWADWLRSEGKSDKTIATRLGGVRSLCGHARTDDPLSITTVQVVTWLAACKTAWTRRTYFTTARAWHEWLVEQDYRRDDPTSRLKTPPAPRGLPRPAPSSALDAVLIGAPRIARAYICLAAYEGLRVHEIAKLRGEDFDGEGWLYVLGKGDHAASLPVHPMVEQLRRGFPDEGWWFPGETETGHVLPNSVSRAVSQAFRRRGYRVTAHQLRHWFGTHTLRTSRDLRVTQELMRHASMQSTQIYTEVAGRAKQEAVWRLGNGRGA